jgi:hypothetical protein
MWGVVVDMHLLERRLDRLRMAVPIVDLEIRSKSF